eukprot:gene6601-8924_t
MPRRRGPEDYPTPDLWPEGGFTLDRALVYALVWKESRFNAYAVSGAGAMGLMQVRPVAAARAAGDDKLLVNPLPLLDGPTNLRVGQDYFTWLMERALGGGPEAYDVLHAGRGREVGAGLEAEAGAVEFGAADVAGRRLHERDAAQAARAVDEFVNEEGFVPEVFFAETGKETAVETNDEIEVGRHAGHGIGFGDDAFAGIQIHVQVGKCRLAFEAGDHF